jgi:type VI secretion system secreted protein Hcp
MNIIRFKKLGSHLMLIILSICYLVILFPTQICVASQKQINIAGLWRSNINLEYKIFQNNTNFTWDVIGKNQKANGKINGLNVSASWQGQKGMTSASGTISLDPLGRAIAIKWSNGVVFKRDLPPERGLQGGQPSKTTKVQLGGKTVDHPLIHKTAYSAVDVLLKLDDIQGESVIQDHEDEIDVLAWSWEISNQSDVALGGGRGAGKTIVGPLTVTKYIDKASPRLIREALKGSIFSEAILVVRKAGKYALDYLKITMSDVKVTNVSNSGVSGDDRPTESVTLVFSKVRYEYTPEKEDGHGDAAIGISWDIEKNVEL